MTNSEQINELAAALAKAQGAMEHASKDGTNPHFRSKYATLASVWEAARKPLSANGLSVIQTAGTEGTTVSVDTLLAHSSGQWIRSSLSTQARDAGPQAIGSCISYLRRYALSAMVGICADDDDGEAATARETHEPVNETTGEVLPDAPAGYHYVTGYHLNNEWHEATVLKWDARGGALKVSTKKQAIGTLLEKFCAEGVAVKVDVTAKKNAPGQAYLNNITPHNVAKVLATPPVEPFIDMGEVSANDIPFAFLLAVALSAIGLVA